MVSNTRLLIGKISFISSLNNRFIQILNYIWRVFTSWICIIHSDECFNLQLNNQEIFLVKDPSLKSLKLQIQ